MVAKSILQSMAYFDVMSHPPTAEELFSYLWQAEGGTRGEFAATLGELCTGGKLHTKDSFYFLPGHEAQVYERQAAVKEVEKKLRRAKLAASIIAWVPFVRAIFVCNSVAAEEADKNSDIDFFIVTAANRAWTVRLITNMLLHFTRLRRHGTAIANRVCLSFYVDENNIDLKPLAIAKDDVYLAFWLRQLLPLYDPAKVYENIKNKNSWQHGLLAPKSTIEAVPHVRLGIVRRGLKQLLEWCGSGRLGTQIEKALATVQRQKIARSSVGKERSVESAVITTNGILKFHEKDARTEIRERWLVACNNLKAI